jgi:hypothetical protein
LQPALSAAALPLRLPLAPLLLLLLLSPLWVPPPALPVLPLAVPPKVLPLSVSRPILRQSVQ